MALSQRNIYVIKGVPAREKQMFQAAASTPWAIKPVFGLLNDCLPIKGWEKSLYLLGVACAGSAAWMTIGVFGERLPGEAICVCFFAILAQVAWTDLMVEGLYTVRMKQHPQYGSDLVTYVWSGITFCGAIGVLLAGPAIDLLGPYNVSSHTICSFLWHVGLFLTGHLVAGVVHRGPISVCDRYPDAARLAR